MPGSGGLGVPGPAGEVRSVPAPSVLCPPHPVSGQESLGVQEPHLLGEEAEGGSSYACGPDLGGLDLAGIGAQSAGNWRPHLHLSENPETPDLGDQGWRGETASVLKPLFSLRLRY